MMQERIIYIEIMERLFHQWSAQIDIIKNKVQQQDPSVTGLSKNQIKNLQIQKETVEENLKKVKTSSDELWEESRQNFEKKMSSLKALLDKTKLKISYP